MCPFQAAAYTIVLSYKGKRVGSVLGKIEGNSVNKLIKSTLAIESSKTFEASVTVEGKPSTMKATCFESKLDARMVINSLWVWLSCDDKIFLGVYMVLKEILSCKYCCCFFFNSVERVTEAALSSSSGRSG